MIIQKVYFFLFNKNVENYVENVKRYKAFIVILPYFSAITLNFKVF